MFLCKVDERGIVVYVDERDMDEILMEIKCGCWIVPKCMTGFPFN